MSAVIKYGLIGFVLYELFRKDEPVYGQGAGKTIKENAEIKNRFMNKEVFPYSFGGNPDADNVWGKGKFNYELTVQNLYWEDELREAKKDSRKSSYIPPKDIIRQEFPEVKLVGLECRAVTVLNLFKSLGIIHPKWSSLIFEENHTNIFSDADLLYRQYRRKAANKDFSLDSKYNSFLRGFPKEDSIKSGMPYNIITPSMYVQIAEKIAAIPGSYAEKSGMKDKKFLLKKFGISDLSKAAKHTDEKGVIYANIKYGTGNHYVLITSIDLKDRTYSCDDPLKGSARIRNISDITDLWSIDYA